MGEYKVRVQQLLNEWGLSNPVHIPSPRNTPVYSVTQNDGGTAVLKILDPEKNEDETEGATLLRYYAGTGAIKVIESQDDAFLLEYANGQELASHALNGHDMESADIICDVVKKLHQKRNTPAPSSLRPLERQLKELFDEAKKSSDPIILEAAKIAQELLDTTTNPIPLHGDLHHYNIMKSERGWLAIDPKGLIGDPCYEISNIYGNPLGVEHVTGNQERADALTEKFATSLSYPKERIAKFAFVHNVISSLWGGCEFMSAKHRKDVAINIRRQFT